MKVVVDTNILVRATKNASGPARELLHYFEQKQAVLILSPYLLTELARVLAYPRLLALHGLSPTEIQVFLGFIAMIGEGVADPPHGESSPISDPDDDPIVRLAVHARVDVLCSLDRHVHHQDVTVYLARHQIRVLTDVELLALLRERTPS